MLSPNHPNLDPNRRLSTSFSPPHSSDRMGYDSRSGARTECTRGSITCWMSDATSREPDRLDLSTISWREAERSSIDWPGRKPSRDWNRFINRHRPSTPSPAPALSPSPRRARAIPYSFHPPSLPLARIRRCVDYAGGGFSSRRRGVPREKKLSRNLDSEFLVIFFICWNDKSEDGWLWYGELVPF